MSADRDYFAGCADPASAGEAQPVIDAAGIEAAREGRTPIEIVLQAISERKEPEMEELTGAEIHAIELGIAREGECDACGRRMAVMAAPDMPAKNRCHDCIVAEWTAASNG